MEEGKERNEGRATQMHVYFKVQERKREKERGRKNEEEATTKTPGEHSLLVAPLRRHSFLFLQDHGIHGNRFRGTKRQHTAAFPFLRTLRSIPWKNIPCYICDRDLGISRLLRRKPSIGIYTRRALCAKQNRGKMISSDILFLFRRSVTREESSTDDLNPDLNPDMNNL